MLYTIIRRKRRPLIEVAPEKPGSVVPPAKPAEAPKQAEQQKPAAQPEETIPKDESADY